MAQFDPNRLFTPRSALASRNRARSAREDYRRLGPLRRSNCVAVVNRPVSRAGPQEVGSGPWLGLASERGRQPIRHSPGRPGGNMAAKPNTQAWREILDGPVL
jgi:hypothetical protein